MLHSHAKITELSTQQSSIFQFNTEDSGSQFPKRLLFFPFLSFLCFDLLSFPFLYEGSYFNVPSFRLVHRESKLLFFCRFSSFRINLLLLSFEILLMFIHAHYSKQPTTLSLCLVLHKISPKTKIP